MDILILGGGVFPGAQRLRADDLDVCFYGPRKAACRVVVGIHPFLNTSP